MARALYSFWLDNVVTGTYGDQRLKVWSCRVYTNKRSCARAAKKAAVLMGGVACGVSKLSTNFGVR